MRPTEEIPRLAQELIERLANGEVDPVLLFLGTGCARAAGAQTPDELAPRVMTEVREMYPALTKDLLPPNKAHDEAMVIDAFYELLRRMSNVQRSRLLSPYYARVPVPLFYWDLANLIVTGYFPQIITTNFDSLLEQALESVGLRSAGDYRRIVLSGHSHDISPPDDPPFDPNPPTIIKLHGDLGQAQVAVTPEEVERAVMSQRRLVKGELMGDIVMVGYEFESPPIEGWLERSHAGRIWWVAPERPDPVQMNRMEAEREITYVDGDAGEPEMFFGMLVELLLRRPVLKALQTSVDEMASVKEAGGDVWTEIAGMPISSLDVGPDEDIELELLQGQLQRSEVSRRTVEQTLGPGERNPRAKTQIDYLSQRSADLEGRLRMRTQDRLLRLMHKVADEVSRASSDPALAERVDPSIEAFLREQVSAVERESSKSAPNQDVVSAAIGAMIVLGQRLPNILPDSVVSELSQYGPSGPWST